MRVSFLTPWGSLAVLAVLVPLIALWLSERRSEAVRRTLGLRAPGLRAHLPGIVALACAFGLLGAAAAQPVVRTTTAALVRTDAQVFVVLDTTRSMLASRAPGTPTRFERAAAFALSLRPALPDVSVGVATITNRPLPHLFPTADQSAFAATVRGAIGINNPPPGPDVFRRTTSFESLESFAKENFFSPDSIHRLVVLLSDGESHGFVPKTVARTLAQGGVELIAVRFGNARERIYLAGGKVEPRYRPDPYSQQFVTELASLTVGGRVYEEDELHEVIAAARPYLGDGAESTLTTVSRATPLGLYLALAAALPLVPFLALGFAPRRPGVSRRGALRARLHTVWSSGARDPRGRSRSADEEREPRRDRAHPSGDRRRAPRAGPAPEGRGARA